MANSSDALLSKLEPISWLYSIKRLMNGREHILLIKYLVEEDFYAVMVTDLTQTYFECLEGKDIDEHYRRFNKGELKRERIVSQLKSVLSDVTKAEDYHFETLLVDCHTSRLTLKIRNQMSLMKFDWSFYMISTNPETLSRHLTLPLLQLVATLRHGIEVLRKDIKSKDKLLEQMDANHSKTESTSSDESLTKMLTIQKKITTGTDENKLIENLVSDKIILSVFKSSQNSDNCSAEKKSQNNSQPNVRQLDRNTNQDRTAISPEMVSQLNPEPRKKSPTRQSSKKLKL